tara:strand:- start:72 stop:395 length:324 start_codon:yes stop_codon:yes gene_type:complete
MDTSATISLFIVLATTTWALYLINKKENKKEKPKNYKNISQMAQNLSVCSVETRMKVLTELSVDPKWNSEEVEHLKGVLEGMLNKKMFINEDKNKTTGLKIKYAERE